MTDLWAAALGVLDANWTPTGTLPAPRQYPHQWSWDSAFISIGLARVHPDRARAELSSLFDAQWASGLVPHIVYNAASGDDSYFPGARFWNSHARRGSPAAATSTIAQPPVHARAVLANHRADPDSEAGRAFTRAMYPRLVRWHDYLRGRDVDGSGLAVTIHPWESGLDNSPMWDGALVAARSLPSSATKSVRRDTIHVATDERPTDRDYQDYISLADHARTRSSDRLLIGAPFLVQDPLLNAVYLDGELCLAQLADELGVPSQRHQEAARRIHDGLIGQLWDADRQIFVSRDARTGTRSTVATIGSLIPLLDPWLGNIGEHVLALAESDDFAGGCEFPLPSTALRAPQFNRRRYWRGPTWLNTNWLVWLGASAAGHDQLAQRIATSSLRLVRAQGFREYYDPIDGAGMGAHQFSWSAALVLDWIAGARTPVA